VMMRESTAANSRFAMVVATPSQGINFQWRTNTGGTASGSTVTGTPPRWVRLRRQGNVFTAFYCSDGINWVQIGNSRTIAMATATQAGLAVTSHDNTKKATAGFSSFSLTAPDTVAPTLTSAASRKSHGSAGTFDMPLSLSTPTVEPRSGGSNLLVFNFSEPIRALDGTLDASEFVLTNATFSSATISGNTLSLRLANVANRARATVQLAGISDVLGNALSGTSAVTVRNLYGDVNRSGSVTVADQQAVKNGLFQPVSLATYLLDVTLNGSISVGDQQAVKNALFTSVP